MRLNSGQKKFIVIQTVLFFLFVSLLWLLDVSVSFLQSGQVETLIFIFRPVVSYHLALIGIIAVYFISFTYFLHKIREDDND